jgi:hypothetical protein
MYKDLVSILSTIKGVWGLGAVVHAYNLNYVGCGDRKVMVQC